jgi:hypothetical protein
LKVASHVAVVEPVELWAAIFLSRPVGLLLMPYTPNGFMLLGVEWTLVYEMTFYVVLFAIAAVGLQLFIPSLAALWTVAA